MLKFYCVIFQGYYWLSTLFQVQVSFGFSGFIFTFLKFLQQNKNTSVSILFAFVHLLIFPFHSFHITIYKQRKYPFSLFYLISRKIAATFDCFFYTNYYFRKRFDPKHVLFNTSSWTYTFVCKHISITCI